MTEQTTTKSTEKSLGRRIWDARQAQVESEYRRPWEALSDSEQASLEALAQALAAVVREQCAQACEAERAEFLEQSAQNNGRESDMAFGSVCSSERIAAAIRSMKP